MVRVSAAFGVVLMVIYWFAHMDWPFIENTNNFIVDYHLVYAGVLVTLIVTRAGHVFGLDAWAENLRFVKRASCTKAAGCLTSGYSKDERGPALFGSFLSQCLLVADINRRFKFRTRSRFP